MTRPGGQQTEAYQTLLAGLSALLDPKRAQAAMSAGLKWLSLTPDTLTWGRCEGLIGQLRTQLQGTVAFEQLDRALGALGQQAKQASAAEQLSDVELPIRSDGDLSKARRAAQTLVIELGMGQSLAVRVATVASELSRIIITGSGTGRMILRPERTPRLGVTIIAVEEATPGPPAAVDAARAQRFRDLALLIAKRLMDHLTIEPARDGRMKITAVKYTAS